MATYTIKQNDNYPDLQLTLSDKNGPINLTSATAVKLILKFGTTSVVGAMTKTDAANGVVTYTWAAGSTAVAGTYKGEVEITWATGKIETVPNDGYFEVIIMADLG